MPAVGCWLLPLSMLVANFVVSTLFISGSLLRLSSSAPGPLLHVPLFKLLLHVAPVSCDGDANWPTTAIRIVICDRHAIHGWSMSVHETGRSLDRVAHGAERA